MSIHREGNMFISVTLLLVAASGFGMVAYGNVIFSILNIVLAIVLLFFLQFFRNPKRHIPELESDEILCPADGRIVAIEETSDHETGLTDMVQVSIFMSPFNVHVNRVPIDGKVTYYKYHKGGYLVASHPKSSSENERNTFIIDTGKHKLVLRQIAGAIARRIVSYPSVGDSVQKGNELGFIKFGSRCDLLVPKGTEILVNIGDEVKGNIHVIGRLPS